MAALAPLVYTLTIGLSAFLLFLVQPLISKMLLPGFGGGASVWITSLVFFQTALLLGYALAHLVVRRFGLRGQLILTVALLMLSLLALPINAGDIERQSLSPSLHLFGLLLLSAGAPYLMLATTSPTLQYWIANDGRTASHNPYVQYGVSNLGSLLGLLTYPFLIEPMLNNAEQSWLWTTLYALYAVLMMVTVIAFPHREIAARTPPPQPEPAAAGLRLRWLFQALVPSALLLVVTHYLTRDVVNLPLLWVVPLCVYLITFIVCFLVPRVSTPSAPRTLLGIMSIGGLLLANHPATHASFAMKITAALLCLFGVAMIFHGDLERGKPHKQDLTNFYLHLAAGGSLGSILAGVVAPLVFASTFEFYVVLVAALYYVVVTGITPAPRFRWLLRGGVALSLAVSWVQNESTLTGAAIYSERSFYSTYAVRERTDTWRLRSLAAGTHIHGEQFVEGPHEHEPIAYYHDGTGLADLFELLQPARVGAIGLGVGAVVEYGNANTQFDLYELDPLVVEIARTRFTTLSASPATLRYIIGDGRIRLRTAPPQAYELLVLDAFTSGSIPTHLVTLEAMSEYLDKLAPQGAIAYHISNRHIDLLPVLSAIAATLDLTLLHHESLGSPALHKYPATWVMLTRRPEIAADLQQADRRWRTAPNPDSIPDGTLWRDDFSSIWTVLK